jgi:hypothetical protein
MLRLTLIVLSFFVVAGCSSIPTPIERVRNAEQLVLNAHWQSKTFKTDTFKLRSFISRPDKSVVTGYSDPSKLTVYIEGDGFAWMTRSKPSTDPTPINLLALKLALRHAEVSKSMPMAYLARPCQFVREADSACAVGYWTRDRFSEEVIESTSQALDQLKAHFQVEQLVLIGYSGGGAVATLVAAQRADVVRLVTVAGNLDHQVWTQLHGISPLTGSLNPADKWLNLSHILQLHLVGSNDKVITPEVSASYLHRFLDDSKVKVRLLDGFDHHCCWLEAWPQPMIEPTF